MEKGEIAQMSNFTFFHNVFYTICILKSSNSHISAVVCSFLEFRVRSQNGVLGNGLICTDLHCNVDSSQKIQIKNFSWKRPVCYSFITNINLPDKKFLD